MMNQGRVWYKYSWIDSRLAYDATKFGGIANLKVDASLIWVPDITLYNRYVSTIKPLDVKKQPHALFKGNIFKMFHKFSWQNCEEYLILIDQT